MIFYPKPEPNEIIQSWTEAFFEQLASEDENHIRSATENEAFAASLIGLMNRGICMTASDEQGRTPLHMLVTTPGMPDAVIKACISHYADHDFKDKNGEAHRNSSQIRHPEIVTLLPYKSDGTLFITR